MANKEHVRVVNLTAADLSRARLSGAKLGGASRSRPRHCGARCYLA